jgi:hypothetical protein
LGEASACLKNGGSKAAEIKKRPVIHWLEICHQSTSSFEENM